jgi:hypothetical protein
MLSKTIFLLVAAFVLAMAPCDALGDTITLNPIKDNTLIDEPGSNRSNALGSLYSGQTGPQGGLTRLRCVLAFDVAGSVPAGSTINGATLLMRLEQTSSLEQTHALHKVLADWGEGTSAGGGGQGGPATPGDVTWVHRFYNTEFWATPGGDFVPSASATQIVGADSSTDYAWTSPQLAADVQAWLDAPATSFGWIMIGNEIDPNTTKKFYSRETPEPTIVPRLVIDFTPETVDCPADIDSSGAVDVDDLVAVILAWGACPKPPASCEADIDDSGAVDVDDLVAVILYWGACG